jgi:hypothetical protein
MISKQVFWYCKTYFFKYPVDVLSVDLFPVDYFVLLDLELKRSGIHSPDP